MKLYLLIFILGLALLGCTSDTTPPAIPSGLQATPADGSLSLKWTANTEPDLASYVLSWRPSSGGPSQNKTVAAPLINTLVDGLSNDTTYVLTLVAVDKTGNKSAASAPLLGSPKAPPPTDQPPAKPVGLSATAQDAQVSLNWTPNAELDLKDYTLHYGTSSTNLDKTQSIEAPSTSTVVVGLGNDTPYFFALEARSSKGLKSARTDPISATPKAVPQAPVVQEVALTDYGLSNQVRQGAGDIEIAIKGLNLATLSGATLGSYALSVKSKQADGAKLSVNIPHGAALGDHSLTIENGVGSFSFNAAVEVTKITSASKPELSPSDTSGKGTPNRPFRTLSKALSVAQQGDTVLLTAGLYQTGETWPSGDLAQPLAPNVAAGVVVEGQSSDRGAVLLIGPGNTTNFVGLVLAGNATLRNLTVRNFAIGILRQGLVREGSDSILIENIAASQNVFGAYISQVTQLTIKDSLFSANGSDTGGLGIFLRRVAKAQILGTQFNNNQTGIFLDRSEDVSAEKVEVAGNKQKGIEVENSKLSLINCQVMSNLGVGILVNNSLDTRTFSASHCTVEGNASHGINVMSSASSLSITSSELYGNAGWQLYDERSANNPNPIYAYLTTYEGVNLAGQLSLTSGTGGAQIVQDDKKLLRIDQPGNTIHFTL